MSLLEKLNLLPRLQKQIVTLIVDIVSIILSIGIAFVLLSTNTITAFEPSLFLPLSVLAILSSIPIFISFGLYHAVLRYAGTRAYWTAILASASSISLWVLTYIISGLTVANATPVITFLVLVIMLTSSRALAKSLFLVQIQKSKATDKKNVLIYGANRAGSHLATALSHAQDFNLIAFIDDNPALRRQTVNDKKVYSLKEAHSKLLSNNKTPIHEVLLAIPSNQNKRANIVRELEQYTIKVRTLPSLLDLAQGKVTIDSIRELNLEDLLGRDPVKPIKSLIEANLKTRNIMITGAGGSIGSELCRQIIQQKPQLVVIYELSEFALYKIEKELRTLVSKAKIRLPIKTVLGNVTNQKRLERTCTAFGINTIYHAAAYKHVPMVEKNISEGVNNNIFGTYYCAQAAINTHVDTFVLISTDKAVRPTNTMGATKRFAELILQTLAANKTHKTRFTMVRFGNVLGSSGSVIPLFREQIKNGGPVTITDKNMERYFMTIPEASQLVIQAGAMGTGGDVFVLDMGKPVKIVDLAKRMIKLSGLTVQSSDQKTKGIPITYTGLRSGEKISEELLIGNNTSQTEHPRIMRADEETISAEELNKYLDELNKGIEEEDEVLLRNILMEVVTGYKPQCGIVDVLRPELTTKLAGSNLD